MQIRLYHESDREIWDAFVQSNPASTHCYLSGWKNVFERAYHHKGEYFLAEENGSLIGILPLCRVKSLFFGNQLVSVPFLNYGGPLTNSDIAKRALIAEAIKLAKETRTSRIELRNIDPLGIPDSTLGEKFFKNTQKVRMLLKLPDSREGFLESFKAKMRSQIFRAQREGMKASIGGIELLDDFYQVFSHNMRDLGSPVHSKKFFAEIMAEFKSNSRIGVIQYQNQPVATGLIICFQKVVEIPWASSLREFNRFSPNMFLYWTFLEYARDKDFKYFDFGRSTFGEGTYKFKQQWGAEGHPLNWIFWSAKKGGEPRALSENKKFQLVSTLWKKLPFPLTVLLGPHLRKIIPL